MGQRLFISYSRRQTPFVDRLAEELENQGYSAWVDYRSLIPARPWLQQLEEGIAGADAFLLIVSSDSMSSNHVKSEWQKARERNKRIVLVIFEAIALPEELQSCEWLDLRAQYKQNFSRLIRVLESSGPVAVPAPQSGLKYPILFWVSIALSAVLAVLILPLWFTIIIPYLIISLPWKIYRHNYVLSLLQPVLLFLPLINMLPRIWDYPGSAEFIHFLADFAQSVSIPLWIISWLLLIILHLPVMQRLGHPEAALIRFSYFSKPPKEEPRRVPFTIENAAEDTPYANIIRKRLENLGHRFVVPEHAPEAIFVLISIYKNSTSHNPDRQAVYPILIQDQINVEDSLSRIQWIDFRRGIRNLDKLGRLLPQPERLLKALGVPPMGNQRAFPFVIDFLQYFFILIGVLNWGGILNATIFVIGEMIQPTNESGFVLLTKLFMLLLSGFVQLGTVYLGVRGLRTRKGAGSSMWSLFLLTIWQAALLAAPVLAVVDPNAEGTALGSYVFSAAIMPVALALYSPVAFLFLILVVLLQIRQLIVYLPRHQYRSFDGAESWFLLYTPPGVAARALQLLFHLSLIFLFLYFYLAAPLVRSRLSTLGEEANCLWILFVIALVLRGVVNYLTEKSIRSRALLDQGTLE